MTKNIILLFIGAFFILSCETYIYDRYIYNVVTFKKPGHRINKPPNFGEPTAQAVCLPDTPFENEEVNQVYTPFFQQVFFIYKVNGLEVDSYAEWTINIASNNGELIIFQWCLKTKKSLFTT